MVSRVSTRPLASLSHHHTLHVSSLADACRAGASSVSASYPTASSVTKFIPVYHAADLQSAYASTSSNILEELHSCLRNGAGVFVVKGLYEDMRLLDRCDRAFQSIIERERREKGCDSKGDHFAPAGQNDRVWNSFQKLAMESSEDFVEYYANPVLNLVCRAWLGRGYQMTSQLNIVKPGGKAQEAHRDFHLGFADPKDIPSYPLITQISTQFLTLQGAVAHTDMPLASGPTQLLPFSQLFSRGYLEYRQPENLEYFAKHAVQLPLSRGDGLFFNPALHHAAGDNTTNNPRSANLLQVSSPFGRAMEVVDRRAIVLKCWPSLKRLYETEGGMTARLEAAISSLAEGYAFPTNLDKDPPPSGSDVILSALMEGWSDAKFFARLDDWSDKRVA